jgi:hypothetical protein
LTGEQKRQLIGQLLKANPEQSDRAVAKLAQVDHKTVGSVRAEAEQVNGEIPHKPERTEASGRKARGRKPITPTPATAASLKPTGPAPVIAKTAPAATIPKTPAEPRVPASRQRDEWVVATSAQLSRDFDGTVEAIGKMLGEHKVRAEELSEPRRAQLLAPIANVLGPQRVATMARPNGLLEP